MCYTKLKPNSGLMVQRASQRFLSPKLCVGKVWLAGKGLRGVVAKEGATTGAASVKLQKSCATVIANALLHALTRVNMCRLKNLWHQSTQVFLRRTLQLYLNDAMNWMKVVMKREAVLMKEAAVKKTCPFLKFEP